MHRFILHFLAAALTAAAAAKQDSCKVVAARIPGRISYPDSNTYNLSISSYYGGQERALQPSCVFRPTTTDEVSQFVKIMSSGKCQSKFAVRGGGHTFCAGAANIEPGITVDMRLMNHIDLSKDKKVASIGGGSIWDDAYSQLAPHNLTVLGGRVPGIGVGGFATGGGITFASREHGFSCDNIHGYEIILASGKVIYADQKSYPDLWLALKGGSNNFGIITRFDVATIPQGKMWYSFLHYNYTDVSLLAHAGAFSNFMEPENHDGAAMMGMFLDFVDGKLALSDAMWYTKEIESPPIYDNFTKIPNLGGTSELDTVDNVIKTFGENLPSQVPRGFQLTFSFQNTRPLVYMELFKNWEQALSKVSNVEGIFVEFLIQPHPVTKGTNMFGLTPGKTDDVMVDMTAAYNNESDDALVKSVITDIVNKQRAILKQNGHLMDFIYLNYADTSQKVFQSWGANNVAKLKAVSKKYDPKGVFQKRVPGGFKLPA